MVARSESHNGIVQPQRRKIRYVMDDASLANRVIETDAPARLDRLAWSRFHTLVIVALGITWVLDGLEVTLAGALSGALQSSPTLHLTDADIGFAASCYVAGAVLGALFFGWLTDRLGRKRLFFITLGVYLAATALTAFSLNVWMFAAFRFLTGAGIGGEYTAINSAIQELIPARYRGRTDLIVNGSFWLGAALGALGAVVLLDPMLFAPDIGWRCAFGIGAALGLLILGLRRYIPESPRWLMIHGRVSEAETIVADIERRTASADVAPTKRIRLRMREKTVGMIAVAQALFKTYPTRAALGMTLMTAQAFFYNAIFFTYALVLARFFGVPNDRIGLYILPFAIGNFLGPLILGRFFDSIGRRAMISGTYAISGVLLLVTAWLFTHGLLTATGQTVAWCIVFFFASAAASSAYLTVSESFPLEVRALAIAVFYALGTGVGGVVGPWLFGSLIGTGDRDLVAWGYALGSALMIAAALVELKLGVAAERKSLEDVAAPLSIAS
ncbi:MAG TPA: MFS transporter [Rudaea sp.]|jgi:MFS family permease|nr:MFS transporter [Rudaea sp.]